MSNLLGGKQESKVEMPEWAQRASQDAIALAKAGGEIGYMPLYGPDVAAFTPMQQAGMQGAYDAASAYGLAPMGADAMAGIPAPRDFGGGLMGYSSGDLFEQARAEFEARNPRQAAAFNKMFVPYGTEATNPNFPSTGSDGRPLGYPDYLPWPPNFDMGRFI
jgi:hypothetical protein